MAGDIEEPFSISFRADSLHSGSISFGRYEKEPLDWERRSSFSHNRYLEEVEKCLKPGSVIEKKAYLEAHFKRKGGILSPGSSGSPSCRDYQTSETDHTENDVRRDAFDSIKEGAHRDHFHENDLENGNYREEYNYENEESQCEYASDNIHYVNYDESPEGSTYHVEYETTEHERENPWISYFESHTVLNNAVVVDRISEGVKIEETHQTQIKCDQLPVKNWDPAIEVNHNLITTDLTWKNHLSTLISLPKVLLQQKVIPRLLNISHQRLFQKLGEPYVEELLETNQHL